MKKVFKWIGIVLGSLIGLLLVTVAVLYFMGSARLNKTYDIPPDNIAIPTDAASLELGKHRVETMCLGCHTEDLGGMVGWFVSEQIGYVDSSNLTSGEGGIASTYTDEDFVRAIRHGVNKEGKPTFMIAVTATYHINDKDLGAIIAYLRTVPPVDRQTKPKYFSPFAKVLLAAGAFGQLPAEAVDHTTRPPAPEPGVTVEFGKYLIDINDCRVCHGAELNGGPFPDPTIQLITPNLTPGGELSAWSEEDFIQTLRTGVTPGGHQLSEYMPWQEKSRLTDDELKAMYLYLQSLPKLEQATGQ